MKASIHQQLTRQRVNQSSIRRWPCRLELEQLENRQLLSTITVNSPRDGDFRDVDLTLREAILLSNGDLAWAALTAAEQGQVNGFPGQGIADTIEFNIGGGVLHTIAVGSESNGAPLPAITDSMTVIDGYSQPGTSFNTEAAGNNAIIGIELAGNPTDGNGLTIRANDCLVRGLAIYSFSRAGVYVDAGMAFNIMAGNFIGTSALGLQGGPVHGNLYGVEIDNARNNWIGGVDPGQRNLISGNQDSGVYVHGVGETARNNWIQGNFIGTSKTGTAALGNWKSGVWLDLDLSFENSIGGSSVSARNVIAGNGVGGNVGDGVHVEGGRNNLIQNNLIGTDVTGQNALANTGDGVFVLDSSSNELANNVISGNLRNGLVIQGALSSSNGVVGNLIGTNLVIPPNPPDPGKPAKALPNLLQGVVLADNSRFNIIGQPGDAGRNIVSGNGQYGIMLDDDADDNVVRNNYIGTDDKGTAKIPNGNSGVYIKKGFRNTIGGGQDADRNLISGNQGHGIEIAAASDNNRVQKSYIGVQKDGKTKLPNDKEPIKDEGTNTSYVSNTVTGDGLAAIWLLSTLGTLMIGNYVGIAEDGTATGNAGDGILVENSTDVSITSANVISSNTAHGIHVIGGSGHTILSNVIGAYSSIYGVTPGNSGHGVLVEGSNSTTIGGIQPRNLIGGNLLDGVRVIGGSHVIRDNDIGAAGPGNYGTGIYLQGVTNTPVDWNLIANNLVDGINIASGDGNTMLLNDIHNNGRGGVYVVSGLGNRITQNSIYSNGTLGIDLAADGVTPNDPQDPDLGPNERQNFPIITEAIVNGNGMTLLGFIDSKPNTAYLLEFFSNTECDPSGHGEGRGYLGSWPVTTDATGAASFFFLSSLEPFVAATATDPAGNTSEFSPCFSVGGEQMSAPKPFSVNSATGPTGSTPPLDAGAIQLLSGLGDTATDGSGGDGSPYTTNAEGRASPSSPVSPSELAPAQGLEDERFPEQSIIIPPEARTLEPSVLDALFADFPLDSSLFEAK